MSPVITATSISKRFGNAEALAGVSLSVGAGETVVLIGPSGCGKSTLLRIINGIVSADAGVVHFGDVRLGADSVNRLRHGMGYVIQEGGLFPHMTARDNATVLARFLGWGSDRMAERSRELAEAVRLPADLLDRFPLELSGGQRQRVSLMRALFVDPEVLLLDEPLGALDPMIRAELQADLRDLFSRMNKTVLLVTHDLAEAAFFADRIVLMQAGTIVQEGSLADFEKRPTTPFVSKFIAAQQLTHGGLA
ncbi:MAG: ATP-binding cassette domain-containing protein [Rhodothermales bacterium]